MSSTTDENTSSAKDDLTVCEGTLNWRWHVVFFFTLYHLSGFFGFYYVVRGVVLWKTLLWGYLLLVLSMQGTTVGAHRLWSHKAFKASIPLQLYLLVCQTISYQYSVYHWVKDHKMHHRYVDTDADPHNAMRGFFFAQIGWPVLERHEKYMEKLKTIDLTEIRSDKLVMAQHNYYWPLSAIIALAIPTMVPWYFWNERLLIAWCVPTCLRFVLSTHFTGFINSISHMWGMKPYDQNIYPTENLLVSVCTMGEGFHNYHHTYPWDYKAGEFGGYSTNMNSRFIEICERFGLASDLKSVSGDLVKARCLKTGDGSRKFDE